MSRYIAFLRGINVGGRIIKMADLKSAFEKHGYQNVKTVLQTGNVVFETENADVIKLKQEIETLLSNTFNYPAKVQVFTQDQLASIVEACPFGEPVKDIHYYVLFLENNLEKELMIDAADIDKEVEEIQAGDGVVYWKVPRGMTLKSSFAKYLTKAKYKDYNTNRNLNTLQKIVQI